MVIPRLAARINAAAVFWNRRYGAAERAIDETVKTALKAQNVEARSFNGHLLYEPWSVKTKTGGSFRVFSAFWRAARRRDWNSSTGHTATDRPALPLPT